MLSLLQTGCCALNGTIDWIPEWNEELQVDGELASTKDSPTVATLVWLFYPGTGGS
jgi:hypothetical protein